MLITNLNHITKLHQMPPKYYGSTLLRTSCTERFKTTIFSLSYSSSCTQNQFPLFCSSGQGVFFSSLIDGSDEFTVLSASTVGSFFRSMIRRLPCKEKFLWWRSGMRYQIHEIAALVHGNFFTILSSIIKNKALWKQRCWGPRKRHVDTQWYLRKASHFNIQFTESRSYLSANKAPKSSNYFAHPSTQLSDPKCSLGNSDHLHCLLSAITSKHYSYDCYDTEQSRQQSKDYTCDSCKESTNHLRQHYHKPKQ